MDRGIAVFRMFVASRKARELRSYGTKNINQKLEIKKLFTIVKKMTLQEIHLIP